jgi:ADP-ribosylation factor-like protein 2
LIWVVDSCDKIRLADCKRELHSMLKQEKLAGATLLIFCNKQDVDGALKDQEIREFLELDRITTRHWGIIPCSAMTGYGLYDGIEWLVDDMSSRVFMND